MDSSLRHLIERMLDKDPKRRATLEGVMSHEWITREGIEPMEPIFHPNLNAKYVPLFSYSPILLSPYPLIPLSRVPRSVLLFSCPPCLLSFDSCLLYLSLVHCQHTYTPSHTMNGATVLILTRVLPVDFVPISFTSTPSHSHSHLLLYCVFKSQPSPFLALSLPLPPSLFLPSFYPFSTPLYPSLSLSGSGSLSFPLPPSP